ncbi:MAG: hypothetical protein QM775_20650 [Pirellulales bacterium]
MTNLHRQVAAVQRRLLLARFVRALPWSAAAAFALAAVVILAGKYWQVWYQQAWPAWSTVLGAATGLTLVGAAAWRASHDLRRLLRPSNSTNAVACKSECPVRWRWKPERQPSTMPTRAMTAAIQSDAEHAVAKLDAGKAFPVAWPKREAWPVLPATIAVALAIWFTPQIKTTPAGEKVEAATTAVVQEEAKKLADKLEQRRKEAELMKLAEAQRLLDKLRDEARQLQSADNIDQKDALLKLSDMASELAERRKEVETAQILQKELSRLKSKKKGPADEFAEAMSKGDYKSAADQLQQLRKELEKKQLDPEKKQQLADQLQSLQKQLEEMAEARKEMQKELEQKAQEAAGKSQKNGEQQEQSSGGGEQKQQQGNQTGGEQGGQQDTSSLAEQLSQMAAENQQLDSLKDAFEKAAQGMQQSGQGDAEKSLESLQQQLDQLSKMAGENELLQRGLDDLAQSKAGMSQGGQQQADGQGQGDGQERGDGDGKQGMAKQGNRPGDFGGQGQGQQAQQGGLMPGRGTGPGLGKDGSNPLAGGFDSRVRGQVREGAMQVVGPADGPNAKGKVLDAIRKQADAVAAGGEAQKLENQPLDRSRREQKKQYFDALRQP